MFVVEFAFGGDGPGAVLGAGAAAFGHHRCAPGGGVRCGWVFVPEGCGGFAQVREQHAAAGVRGVCVPGWAGPDHGAVGVLAVAPAVGTGPESFQEMMKTA